MNNNLKNRYINEKIFNIPGKVVSLSSNMNKPGKNNNNNCG